MRVEQIAKLRDLTERLVDVAVDECNPEYWPGAGQLPNEMARETRGDRVWAKRDAAGTLGILAKIMSAIDWAASAGQRQALYTEEEENATFERYEQQGQALLAKLEERRKQRESAH